MRVTIALAALPDGFGPGDRNSVRACTSEECSIFGRPAFDCRRIIKNGGAFIDGVYQTSNGRQ
jgi:hypothetical protein